MPKQKHIKTPQQIWESISSTSVNFVERIFFNLGVVVARHPWRTISLTLVFVCLSSIGLLNFHMEKNPMNLWVPPDSDFVQDTNWYINTFGTGFRFQKIIITADNVLVPDVLKTIYDITSELREIQINYQNKTYTINDLCYKVPDVSLFSSSKSGSSNDFNGINNTDFSDSTLWVDDSFYCSFLEEFSQVCLQNNLIDLWKNDLNEINSLTSHDIVKMINKNKINPMNGHPADYTKILGGAKHDESGDIVSATSVILTWYTEVNMSSVDLNEVGNLVGTEDWVSVPLALWENSFLNLMESLSKNVTHVKLYYEAGRSFADVSQSSMFYDVDKLFLGIFLMFMYVQFGLAHCNWLEIKLTLGSVGLLCVGMAYITAVSWCSVLGISFGPVHSSLPFLLMGLGVDDMFVMNACWHNLSDIDSKKSLPIKIGLMLKHAGVSIVITSFTDIVALLIGAITILPSLKSFCIYAAMGVFFVFCYSVTFFVAVFALDTKRIELNRNGICFCYQHKEPIKVSVKRTWFQQILHDFYKYVVFTIPGKVVVILFTVIMTGFSIQAVLRLEQRFDPKWFVPDDTYYKQYINAYEHYYPNEGNPAMVFLGSMDYQQEFTKLYDMMQELEKEAYVNDATAWVDYYYQYVLKNFKRDLINDTSITDKEFDGFLSKFLYSPVGGRFLLNFRFKTPLKCGVPASDIVASSMAFNFGRFHGPEEYIPAMNRVKEIVKMTNISSGDGYRSVWSKAFGNWVTDEIIAVEVERNIELALVCVMVCTIILITNLQMCFWIFICVLLTIVNVLGWMQRWGMTVDIVCCIGLELAIGLCVDYAAHVGHSFLTNKEGSRNERAFKTVTSIGTAVLLGGGATFLSLSLLSMSRAYTFQSFFKIFFLVILFGLFNGLVFLPVVLSLIGPMAHHSDDKQLTVDAVELNGLHDLSEKHIEDG